MSHRSPNPKTRAGGWRWRKQFRAPGDACAPAADAHPAGAGPMAWLPTLRAKGAGPLQRQHLRRLPVAHRPARLHLILLDVSGSMRRGGRLALAKGHAMLLMDEAVRAGDDVGVLSLGGHGVDVLVPPRRAGRAASARLAALGGGGGTPLAAALAQAEHLLRRASSGNVDVECWLWLLTDGRSLEQPQAPAAASRIVIVDFDEPARAIGRCASWAARWGAEHRPALEP